MKYWTGLLVLVLLLTGCSITPLDSTSPLPTVSTPAQPVEALTLDGQFQGMLPFGDDLLLFADYRLVKLHLDSGVIVAERATTVPLPDSGMVQIVDDHLIYFDLATNALVTLDSALQEASRIRLQEPVLGNASLSEDGKKLYYCTSEGIRVWEPETGISRNLKIHSGDWLGIAGSVNQGNWLRCVLQQSDGSLRWMLVAADTGETIAEGAHLSGLSVHGDWYCCQTDGAWIFGQMQQQPQNLLVESATALLQLPAAVSAQPDETGLQLHLYDLQTGLRTASTHIDGIADATGWTIYRNALLFFSGEQLYIWHYGMQPVVDTQCYSDYHYTIDAPDEAGLASIRDHADELASHFGVDIQLWNEVTAAQPTGYTFALEYRPAVYTQALADLERLFSAYPEGFVKMSADWAADQTLHILLVQTLTAPRNVCTVGGGTTYVLGGNIYIVLSVEGALDRALHHALGHVVDTYVLTNSSDFYEWHLLNPSGFIYGSEEAHWEDHASYFINSHSMTSPVEDRATLLEYAMLPGNEAAFASPQLQAKLRRICDGLNKTYTLPSGDYLWAQYLQ